MNIPPIVEFLDAIGIDSHQVTNDPITLDFAGGIPGTVVINYTGIRQVDTRELAAALKAITPPVSLDSSTAVGVPGPTINVFTDPTDSPATAATLKAYRFGLAVLAEPGCLNYSAPRTRGSARAGLAADCWEAGRTMSAGTARPCYACIATKVLALEPLPT